MMHKKNFVAAIKVDGKVLRESSDRVELPFGSEYSILLKNLDSVRMQAQISIDGQEATGWLVLNPNSSVDVERFVKNLDRGNKFKFIERTEEIENYRGIKAEDGLVRIEFKREKVYEAPKVVEHHTYTHYTSVPYNPWITYTNSICTSGTHNVLASTSGILSPQGAQGIISANACNMMRSANDAGITVKGSESQQRFSLVSGFETEKSEVIVLHLVGRKGTAAIPVARTVDNRPTCETCGKRSKAASRFCSRCGTSLEKF